jgi:hypothetical protein
MTVKEKISEEVEILKGKIQVYELQRNGLSKFKILEGQRLLKLAKSKKTNKLLTELKNF